MSTIYYFAYPSAIDLIHNGDLDLVADDLRVLLLTSAYTPSSSHQFLSSVPGGARIGSAVALSSKTFTGKVFSAANTVFSSVAGGSTAVAALIYLHTGTDATSSLFIYNQAIENFPYNTNGGDITLAWPAGGIYVGRAAGSVPA